MPKKTGTVVAIGGKEDKAGQKVILSEVARRLDSGKLIVTAIASEEPEELLSEYRDLFKSLGVKKVETLEIKNRQEALEKSNSSALDDASGVFFTGGDQLRITSQIADTPISEKLSRLYNRGGVIAGTSAGASVMCESMLIEW